MKRRYFITSLVALCLPLPKKSAKPFGLDAELFTQNKKSFPRIRDSAEVTYRINLAQMDNAAWEYIDGDISRAQLQFGIPASAPKA